MKLLNVTGIYYEILFHLIELFFLAAAKFSVCAVLTFFVEVMIDHNSKVFTTGLELYYKFQRQH